MTRYWMGVGSKDHVEVGVAGGFCQLNHGKERPLNRMQRHDWLIYYSPKRCLKGSEAYQCFTAVGQIQGEAYQVEMAPGFIPYRKDIRYAEIADDLPLKAVATNPEWQAIRGQLRFGHFEISEELFRFISSAMGVKEG